MERLLTVDEQAYVSRMQPEIQRILSQVMATVNQAPQGNVINASEMGVRDLMAELRQKAFEIAVQMRIDSTESIFSPSEGCERRGQAKQGGRPPEHVERQWTDRSKPNALAGRRRRQ